MNPQQLAECIGFIQRAENLKNTLRSAHTSTGRAESSAEHSWRLGLMLMVFGQHFEGADPLKLLRLAIIHDLGEAVCGDIPAPSQLRTGDKSAAERQGLDELCAGLPEGMRSEFLALWDEYEGAETLEARIVKGMDKLETLIQHNQGESPPDLIDYDFNLSYGLEYTSGLPLLKQIRALIDQGTRERGALAKRTGRPD